MPNGRMMNNGMSYRPNQSGVMSGNSRMRDKGCDKGNAPVDRMGPGMAYVPWQDWEEVYDMDRAFHCGTIFPELNKPFVGRGGR